MSEWTREKPAEPGEYLVRASRHAPVGAVSVTRRGRGLSCRVVGYTGPGTTCPMSDIGADELEWARRVQ